MALGPAPAAKGEPVMPDERARGRVDGIGRHVAGIPVGHIDELPRRLDRDGHGVVPAAKGEPGITVSAPVVASTAKAETFREALLAT